ncbi:hypothetical protein Tco_0445269 [Tanacetum coccineum]
MQRDMAAQEESSNATLTIEFDDVQARMDADALFLVETIAERKRFFAAQRAEQIRNKPPTKTQLRNKMITFLKNIGKFTYNQIKNKSLEEIQKLYEREWKWINDFIPMDSEMVKDSGKKDDDSQKQAKSSKKRPRAEHDEESVKKQKLEVDAEKEELRACLDIVSGDDIAINVEYLATKYLIVDWKTHILREKMMLSTGKLAPSASVTTGGVSISTAEPRTPPTTITTAFEDEDLTIAQPLVKMRSQINKEKRKGVAFRATQEESTRLTRILSTARPTRIIPTIDPKDKRKGIMQEPEKPPKNPRKAQIQMDEELAMRLHKEEKVALEKNAKG